jgi:hypothetical protein
VLAQALDDVCNLLATGLDPSNGLCAAAYVCLASLTSSLRARALPKLPIFLPRMLSSLEGCILGAGQSQKRARHDLLQPTGPTLLLMRSIVSSLAHITEALPQFVHPYLVRILRVVAEPQMGADSSLSSATDILLSLIRTKLESRLVIPALVEVRACCLVGRALQLDSHMCSDALFPAITTHRLTPMLALIQLLRSDISALRAKHWNLRHDPSWSHTYPM